MNIRKVISLSILLTLITMAGCSTQGYNDAMERGMSSVEEEQFKDSLAHFKEALKEKPDDAEATIAIQQIELIKESVGKLLNEETSEAISILTTATKQKQGSETITNKANEMLGNITSMDEQLHEINDIINKKDYEQAFKLLDKALEENEGKVYMLPFEKQLTSLEDDTKTVELFTYVEGYSHNVDDDAEICQMTDDDIMCTYMSVDLYAYEEIESIKLESDDALKLEIADGSHLIISNISDASYDMYERTFSKMTAEKIVNRAEYYQSIEEVFNRETFKDILQNGMGWHELFKYDGQAGVTDNPAGDSEVDMQSELDNYSVEEIEYARIWLDFLNGSTAPQLTVSFVEKGTLINQLVEDDSIVYPEDVVILRGEYTADGLITYHSNGDGTINVYDIPSHWHQQSDEEMKEATENVLKTIKKREVPSGNDEQVLDILKDMIVEK